ncbi:type I-B CRISPR-associated protein Cas7/Csh2 [Methanoregula sp.]|uniref:type I-B CRISPR-associated protein Cas7/Csh2 n=1 Tax=Methanoregula sp. TaxID=2052170 RepID=UPI003BAFAF39
MTPVPEKKVNSIKNRNEFLFVYDIKNGNPNGDPDENRPRIDEVTKHCYVTDVRLKRFVRDYLIQTDGEEKILVTKLGSKKANLTERVRQSLVSNPKIEGEDLLKTLLDRFIDLRLFGSPLAFKDAPEEWGDRSSLTGPVQINFGETLHSIEEVTFHGWASMPFEPGQEGATPTTYYGIPYGLIAFHGVANENAAKTTDLSEADLTKFKVALWKGIRETSSANTRTKREQQPRLLINIVYKERIKIKENGKDEEVPTEYHIGSLEEKIKLTPNKDVADEINIRKIGDYSLDFTKLITAIRRVNDKIERIEYCQSPEFHDYYGKTLIAELKAIFPDGEKRVINLNIDRISVP